MVDVLIRDVPKDVVAAVDERASALGLSRAEYLRRRLFAEAVTPSSQVSVDDLLALSKLASDLEDPEVMGSAWR